MSQIYALLRNNKNMGPYNLEELIAKGLKPLDLVWMEGKSAGWRYSTEIEELKSYVGLPADTEAIYPQPDSRSALANSEFAVKQTPYVYVSLPGKTKVIPQQQQPAGAQRENFNPLPPDEDAMLTERKETFEERAEKMRQKIVAFESQKSLAHEMEPQTRLSRSLDDIKQEYSSWRIDEIAKKTFKLETKHVVLGVFVPLALIVVFYGGRWAHDLLCTSHQMSNTISSERENLSVITLPGSSTAAQNTLVEKDKTTAASKSDEKKQLQFETNLTEPNALTKNESEKSAVQPEIEKPVEAKKAESKNEIAKQNTEPDPETVEQVILSAIEKKKVPLSQLIHLSSKPIAAVDNIGTGGLEVIVKNNSKHLLTVVAIDVFYYQNKDQPFEKKTLYFSNIPAGQSFKLTAPANKKASGAYYQLGLVSSEEGGLYVDN